MFPLTCNAKLMSGSDELTSKPIAHTGDGYGKAPFRLLPLRRN